MSREKTSPPISRINEIQKKSLFVFVSYFDKSIYLFKFIYLSKIIITTLNFLR